jgi:ecotropic viral integration site 5 protein
MNFLAGYLFLAMGNNEELGFGAMREVIDRYSLVFLFQRDQPMLKLMFYQLDRLIAIYLPDLHHHFKDETINSSYFSSSFFITLFSSIM